ncbi:MAG: hypothetical protein M3552_21450 [Planctomycetota bacterium]|nr:hypothetical protein [Planctomycetaceae bacterium]MDQ3333180.1 hypothetical protein [Planctomycetota bacterium]
MPALDITDEQLTAYLQEQLPLAELAAVEKALREHETLRRRAAALALRRDLAYHSVGSIWRSERLSCPERTELGSYLLGTLDEAHVAYVDFHIRTLGCRYCTANLADLSEASRTAKPDAARRRRYFESSAGKLRSRE